MQARKAVVLSLGELLGNVNVAGFMGTMIAKAKAANADFEFNKDIQEKAFALSENLNRGNMTFVLFKEQLLRLLGIGFHDMSTEEFTTEWNKMINVGNIAETITQLREVLDRHNIILYLVSSTNFEHLKKIEELCPSFFSRNSDSMVAKQVFAGFPLKASCHYRVSRMQLLQMTVKEIEGLRFNKPDDIRVIQGDPANITNPDQKRVVQAEYEAIAKWGAENNIRVDLHNKSVSIAQTLEQMFAVANTAEQAPRMAMGS